MRNALVEAAADVTGDGDGGLVIQEPRKPAIVVAHANARDFCRQMHGAD